MNNYVTLKLFHNNKIVYKRTMKEDEARHIKYLILLAGSQKLNKEERIKYAEEVINLLK